MKELKKKTTVIPLPVVPYKEQYNLDVMKILDSYEKIITDIYGGPQNDYPKLQTGGDQLTRERFTHAIYPHPQARFPHLGPCTFEFFHLAVNFLEKPIIKPLWNDHGTTELGTLKCEKERCIKHSFDTDVMKAYDADKGFVQSFMYDVVLEATMSYFEIESINDKSSTNCLPSNTVEEQNDSVQKHIGAIIDKYVFPGWSVNDAEPVETIIEYNMKSSTNL